MNKKRPARGAERFKVNSLRLLFSDDKFADDVLAVLKSEADGVGAFAEVGEIEGALGTQVVVDHNLLTEGIEDDSLADSLGALNVEHTNGGVGIEADVGVLSTIDAYEGNDGDPAGVVAGHVVGRIVDCGFESNIDIARDIVDTEGVGSGSLVAIGPTIGSAIGAGGIEHSGVASIEMPFAIDSGDDGSLVDGEDESHHAVAAKGIFSESVGGVGFGSSVVGSLVEVPVEAVAGVGISGVVARFVNGNVEVDGAVIALSPTTVGEGSVEDDALTEFLGGATSQGADDEVDGIAASDGSIEFGSARSLDLEVNGTIGYAVGIAVGIEDAIDASSGVVGAAPGFLIASGVALSVGSVNHDGEVEGVESIATDQGVGGGVGVNTGGGVGFAIPSVVAAMSNRLVVIDSGSDVEDELLVVGAANGATFDRDEGSDGVSAGSGVGAVVPGVATASVSVENFGFNGSHMDVGTENAVAKTRTCRSGNGVGIDAREAVGVATPVVGAAVSVDGFVGNISMVNAEAKNESGVVGNVGVGDNGIVDIGLAIDSPGVGLASRDGNRDNGTLSHEGHESSDQ